MPANTRNSGRAGRSTATAMVSALIGLLLLLAGTADARRTTLSLHLAPSSLLPEPQTLPPSTHARLSNANLTLTAPLRRTSRFVFADVPVGSYLCDVIGHGYVFAPLRVDVDESVEGAGAGAGAGGVAVWQTFRGNEWSNTGEKLGETVRIAETAAAASSSKKSKDKNGGDDGTNDDDIVLEVPVTVLGQKQFYDQRPGFNPASLLKNPMILVGGLALLMMFGMPKMIESMDPEMREEFQKQQANSPLAALTGGGGGGGPAANFDMAAWMAGTDKKSAPSSQGKSSGTDGGGAAAKRRR